MCEIDSITLHVLSGRTPYHITRHCFSIAVRLSWRSPSKTLFVVRCRNLNRRGQEFEHPVSALTSYTYPSRSTSSSHVSRSGTAGDHALLIRQRAALEFKLLHEMGRLAALGRRGVFEKPGLICPVREMRARKMTSPTDGEDSRQGFLELLFAFVCLYDGNTPFAAGSESPRPVRNYCACEA